MTVFLLKDKLAEGVRAQQKIETAPHDFELVTIEQEIKSKDFYIRMAEGEREREKMLRDAEQELNKKTNKRKPVTIAKNSERETGAKIQKLKDEKAQLLAKRDALLEKERARNVRTWGEWFDDFNIELLLAALPFVVLWLWLVPQTFWLKLPPRNPLSLTDFERRCVLFLAVAIITSMLGFVFFLWFLSVTL